MEYEERQRRKRYTSYMRSEEWRITAQCKKVLVGFKCERCGYPFKLQVHHKHYRTFGFERMKDLEVLCEYCHDFEHGKRREPGKLPKPKTILRKGNRNERKTERKTERLCSV